MKAAEQIAAAVDNGSQIIRLRDIHYPNQVLTTGTARALEVHSVGLWLIPRPVLTRGAGHFNATARRQP